MPPVCEKLMKMKSKTFGFAVMCLAFAGCSIIPKDVEYFQRKVKPVPTYNTKDEETTRQAAKLAAIKADETSRAALKTNASEQVTLPAREAKDLTQAVSERLGKPVEPWAGDVDALIRRMDAQEARLDKKLAEYKASIAPDVGKKIEGTGFFQMGYFTNIAFMAGGVFILWILIKAVAFFSPPVAVGLKATAATAHFMGRAVGELIDGGQAFKDALKRRFSDDPAKRDELLELFNAHQERRQSADVQELIRQMKAEK